MGDIETRDNPDTEQWELLVDGELAVFAAYHDHGSRRTFTHTETQAGFEGKGLASALVKAALEDARDRGLEINPVCPFVRGGSLATPTSAYRPDRNRLPEVTMQATKGDVLIVHGRNVGNVDRRGEVIDIRGQGGQPPYVVRWEPDGHEGLVFPGPDCQIEAGAKPKPAKKRKK